MDTQNTALWSVAIVFAIAFIGFFYTKMEGYGKYTTAILLLMLVLFVSAIAFFLGKVDSAVFFNVLIAVAGFAGGLFAAKDA